MGGEEDDVTLEDLCDRLTARLREGVAYAWADALPEQVPFVLWAHGAHEHAYALAAMKHPELGAELLAWFASLDPAPGGAAAVRASRAALRRLRHAGSPIGVLACVPLVDPGVARLARRSAREAGQREVLDLRLRADMSGTPAPDFFTAPLMWAVKALRFAEAGEAESARQALAQSLAEPYAGETRDLLAIRVFLRTGAWRDDASPSLAGRTRMAAMIEAHGRGEAAVRALVDRFPGFDHEAELCLVVDGSAPVPVEAATLEEWYNEGLITPWDLEYRGARSRGSARAAGEEAVIGALVGAAASARAFVERVSAAAHGRPPEPSLVARRRRSFAGAVAGARASSVPDSSCVWRLARQARTLVALGDAASVGAAVAELEPRWGPVRQWGYSAAVRAELLADTPGRALEAAALAADEPLPAIAAACLVAGLVRDGHPHEARVHLAALLEEPLAPEVLAQTVTAMVGLDAGAAERLCVAAEEATAGLPADREAARAWLRTPPTPPPAFARRRGPRDAW
jgi:hypothetical protein